MVKRTGRQLNRQSLSVYYTNCIFSLEPFALLCIEEGSPPWIVTNYKTRIFLWVSSHRFVFGVFAAHSYRNRHLHAKRLKAAAPLLPRPSVAAFSEPAQWQPSGQGFPIVVVSSPLARPLDTRASTEGNGRLRIGSLSHGTLPCHQKLRHSTPGA